MIANKQTDTQTHMPHVSVSQQKETLAMCLSITLVFKNKIAERQKQFFLEYFKNPYKFSKLNMYVILVEWL